MRLIQIGTVGHPRARLFRIFHSIHFRYKISLALLGLDKKGGDTGRTNFHEDLEMAGNLRSANIPMLK